jgi:AraC-like DNA-binding protein
MRTSLVRPPRCRLERSCGRQIVGTAAYGAVMLTSTSLVASDGVAVAEVRCGGEHGPAWSEVEPVTGFGVVLVRGGMFRRRVDGSEVVVDAGDGFLQRPGSEQRIAHPVGGDVCTSFALSGRLAEMTTAVPDRPLLTSSEVDLAHRMLVARARAGADPDELSERAVALVGAVLSDLAPAVVAAGLPVRGRRTGAIVDDVRQALAAEPALGLGELARSAGLSPYHVSRMFRHGSGLTISRYRTRLRVRRALERLAGGQHDLAALAHDVGFADQAHLTRAVRAETGGTPARLRAVLGPDNLPTTRRE